MVRPATDAIELDPDAACVAQFGACCVDIRQGKPLPDETIQWTCDGSDDWFDPSRWPWGQYEPGEAMAERIAVADAVKKSCFDETGRVEKLRAPIQWPQRRAQQPDPPRELPPGFVMPNDDDDD